MKNVQWRTPISFFPIVVREYFPFFGAPSNRMKPAFFRRDISLYMVAVDIANVFSMSIRVMVFSLAMIINSSISLDFTPSLTLKPEFKTI
jgi:hypothetical protein